VPRRWFRRTLNPLAQPQQTVSGARTRPRSRTTVVLHHDIEDAVDAAHLHSDVRLAGVLSGVGQRLLDDSDRAQLDGGRQWRHWATVVDDLRAGKPGLHARTRPMLGAVSGLLGLVSVLGVAFHWTFYYLPLASLAHVDDRDMAAHAASTYGDDVLLVVALLMFLVGTLLAVRTAGFGLWRAHALPWWGAIGLLIWLGYVFAGPQAQLAALLNLALLLPFVGVARRLTPSKDTVPEHVPAAA
jgi:hypothetical protein